MNIIDVPLRLGMDETKDLTAVIRKFLFHRESCRNFIALVHLAVMNEQRQFGAKRDDLQKTCYDALEHIVLVIRIVSIFLFDKFIQIRQIDLKSEIRLIIAAVRKHERHDKMHGITVF